MTITRDVIYDLLPGYFAGEVSADTRALIDEFLMTDPEFARMTARFRRLFDERVSVSGDRAPERQHFERARKRAEMLQISAAFTVAYGLGALFPLALDLLRGHSVRGVSLVLASVFGTIALGSAIAWLIVKARSVGAFPH